MLNHFIPAGEGKFLKHLFSYHLGSIAMKKKSNNHNWGVGKVDHLVSLSFPTGGPFP